MIDFAPDGHAALPLVRLTCAAPHRDTRVAGKPCGASLGTVPGWLVLETTSKHPPHAPDGRVWMPCPEPRCRTWNVYRLVTPPHLAQAARRPQYASIVDQVEGRAR